MLEGWLIFLKLVIEPIGEDKLDHSLSGTRYQFCGRQLFHGSAGGQDSFGMIQTHYIYYVFYFLSNATADLTGGTSPWLGGWGPRVRQQ